MGAGRKTPIFEIVCVTASIAINREQNSMRELPLPSDSRRSQEGQKPFTIIGLRFRSSLARGLLYRMTWATKIGAVDPLQMTDRNPNIML
jgi:hypothetical protein